MPTFEIFALEAGAGQLAICPLPGRFSPYQADLRTVLDWGADMVLTMTEGSEGVDRLGRDLQAAGVIWHHLPIRDFGAPGADVQAAWPKVSVEARAVLARGGKVLAHCAGGCGRSGMAVLRLMVELGEDPDAALNRLRAVRPCAVETEAQERWAKKADAA